MSLLYEGRIRLPWTLKIEQSYGCNLACPFCPISNLPEINRNRQFLRPDMCQDIVEQATEIREDFRVELSLRGEPLLNPNIIDNLRIIRRAAPKFQISLFTNGLGLITDRSLASRLLDAGVNILCVECYNNSYDRFLDLLGATGEEIVDFRSFSAYKRHKKGHCLRVVDLVPDLPGGAVNVRRIHNNAGNVSIDYLQSIGGYQLADLPLKRRCVRPFREVVVYYDGRVPICCHDWKASNVLGDVRTKRLRDIWFGGKHLSILWRLFNRNRQMDPCRRCDYHGGYRVGLLHDPHNEIQHHHG